MEEEKDFFDTQWEYESRFELDKRIDEQEGLGSIMILNQALELLLVGKYHVTKWEKEYIFKVTSVKSKWKFNTDEEAKEFIQICMNMLQSGRDIVVSSEGMYAYFAGNPYSLRNHIWPYYYNEYGEAKSQIKKNNSQHEELVMVTPRIYSPKYKSKHIFYFAVNGGGGYLYRSVDDYFLKFGFSSLDRAIEHFNRKVINYEKSKPNEPEATITTELTDKRQESVKKKSFFMRFFGL